MKAKYKNTGTKEFPFYTITVDGEYYCATDNVLKAKNLVKILTIPIVVDSTLLSPKTHKMKEVIELAKTGVDIELHLMTFDAMEAYINALKPLGYQITNVCDYRCNNPNCVFVK